MQENNSQEIKELEINDGLNPLYMYIITQTGRAYSDEGIKYLRDLTIRETRDDIPEYIDGIAVYMGSDLLDPRVLANMLRKTPISRVFVSHSNGIGMMAYGTGENGLPSIIRLLEDAAKNGMDSWTMLMRRLEEKER